MAFGVTKWPLPCDPRTPCFCVLGYAAGAVPPWKYFVQTTGALAPFTKLNDGVLIVFEFEGGGDCVFVGTASLPLIVVDLFIRALGVPPFAPPPADTLRWTLTVTASASGDRQIGVEAERLPFPVDQPPDFDLIPVAGPDLIPNPVSVEPRPWDAV